MPRKGYKKPERIEGNRLAGSRNRPRSDSSILLAPRPPIDGAAAKGVRAPDCSAGAFCGWIIRRWALSHHASALPRGSRTILLAKPAHIG